MLFDTFDRTGSAEFPYPKQVVFRAVCVAVEELPGMRIQDRDDLASRLHVKTGISAFSWGETVSISVTGSGANAALVSIQSAAKSVFGSATTHGKNRENVRKIISHTSALLTQNGAQWEEEMGLKLSTPASTSNEQSPRLVADELMKLAELRSAGILTDAEFDAQKAKLLGG